MKHIVHDSMIMNKDRVLRQQNKILKLIELDELVYAGKALKIANKCHTGLRKDGFHEVSHQLEIVSLLYPLFRYDKKIARHYGIQYVIT